MKIIITTLTERPTEPHPFFNMRDISADEARVLMQGTVEVVGYANQAVIARACSELGIPAQLPIVGGDGIPTFLEAGEQLLVIFALHDQALTYSLGMFKGTGDMMSSSIEVIEHGTI